MKNYLKPLHKHSLKILFTFLVLLFTSQCFASSPVANEERVKKINNINRYLSQFNEVFRVVEEFYVDDLDPKILYEGALKGMMDAIGDPHTTYLDTDTMRDLTDTTEGNFGGVGLTISKPFESKPGHPAYVEVANALEDTPGFKAGIQSGDKIIAIDDKATDKMSMNEVLKNLRGEVGTDVTIKVLRGESMIFDKTLTRALIEVPTVKYGMIDGTSIGYVRLIQFTPDTALRLQDALDSFTKEGYDSLIIDLRDNPGGLLQSAIAVVDKFVDEGLIVSTKSRIYKENSENKATSERTTVSKDIPIVVLINGGSASASEIVSGALKDYKRAYLVGENTYGKGSVQEVLPLYNDDGIKFTVARYYSPTDSNIDKVGIPPDREVLNINKFNSDEEKAYVELLTSNAIEEIVEKKPHMSESEIAKEAKLLKEKYNLDERLLRRMLRVQVQRSMPTPLFDMDFDLQLKEAIKILQEEDFNTLVNSTKTLKQLEIEKKIEEENKKDTEEVKEAE